MSINISALPGGMRIVTDNMAHLETISLGVWSGSGARHETRTQHGLAHLMEHMAFKGTKTRSAFEIADAIEAVGGDINAATGLESTAYYTRILKNDVDLALDILADILQNPCFDQAELEREKAVILQEIGAARDTPDDLVFELFQEAAFPDQPLGRSILGTRKTLEGFSIAKLEQFRRQHYTRPGLVICAAGALDHDDLAAKAHSAFDGLADLQPPLAEQARFQGGDRRENLPLEQVHLVMGFEGVSYKEDDMYAAQVLASILGGGMSSRLFQEVRERRGLCYSVFAFSWSFADSGLFGIYTGADRESASELSHVIANELKKMSDGVSQRELERARAQAKAGLVMSLESSSSRAEQMARQILVFNRVLSINELMSKIEAIDSAAIATLADRLFKGTKLVVAAVGPVQKLAPYEEMAGLFD